MPPAESMLISIRGPVRSAARFGGHLTRYVCVTPAGVGDQLVGGLVWT